MQASTVGTQNVFRKLIEALSYPGRLVELTAPAAYPGMLYPETMDVLLSLLDGEVTFHVLGGDEKTEAEVKIRSLAQKAPLEEADYIVVPFAMGKKAAEAIAKAKKGTLLDPDQSATILLETAALTEATEYVWKGPGIKDQIGITVPDMDLWLKERQEAVSDFPHGLDIFLIGKNQKMSGLPRTTVVKGAWGWDM